MNLAITTSNTVNNIKATIQYEHGFPNDQQCLIFANRQLGKNEGSSTLISVNIRNDVTLLLLLREGG